MDPPERHRGGVEEQWSSEKMKMKKTSKRKVLVWMIPAVCLASSVAAQGNDQVPRQVSSKIDTYNFQSRSTIESTASSESSQGIGLDFHIGPSLATLTGNGVDSTAGSLNNKLGIAAGIGYEIPLSYVFSFRPELNYIQKGVSISQQTLDGGSNLSVTGSINLNYVEVPLLLKAQMPDGSIHPNLVAGPAVGYSVSKSVNASVTGNGNTTSVETGIDSGIIKSIDYGVQFGAGADIPMSNGNSILADFRYDLGLANINNGSSGGTVKNQAMIFTLGFRI